MGPRYANGCICDVKTNLRWYSHIAASCTVFHGVFFAECLVILTEAWWPCDFHWVTHWGKSALYPRNKPIKFGRNLEVEILYLICFVCWLIDKMNMLIFFGLPHPRLSEHVIFNGNEERKTHGEALCEMISFHWITSMLLNICLDMQRGAFWWGGRRKKKWKESEEN